MTRVRLAYMTQNVKERTLLRHCSMVNGVMVAKGELTELGPVVGRLE